jgi:plastocyanin
MTRKLTWLALLTAAMVLSQAVQAESWRATVGAQSADKGVQALAFLPNEIWIHAGDDITWTFNADEQHSVTFLKIGQLRPTFAVGCGNGTVGGTTPNGSSFDGLTCVNSGLIKDVGTTYTVVFPSPGNYVISCLLHANQTGVVHVLLPSVALPHDQDFYYRQAAAQQSALLSDHDGGLNHKFREGSRDSEEGHAHAHSNMVVIGVGELVATPGGAQSVSLMRFMQPSITIHQRETVEWNSSDVSGHSVTFGPEPAGGYTALSPKTANVLTDADGGLHVYISSNTDVVHSGRLAPASQERSNLAQSAPGTTRFRATFMNPGTYTYICAFHDELGMTGEVIVLPSVAGEE